MSFILAGLIGIVIGGMFGIIIAALFMASDNDDN